MKKERVKTVAILCVLALIIGGVLIYQYCLKTEVSYPISELKAKYSSALNESGRESWQLLSNADSLEEAEEIAAMYQVTLLEYADGVALYETQEEPLEVIRRGEQEGYPQMWMNSERVAY